MNNFEKLSCVTSSCSILIRYGNLQLVNIGSIFIIDNNLAYSQSGTHHRIQRSTDLHIFFSFIKVREHLEFGRTIDIDHIDSNRSRCRERRIIRIQRAVRNLHFKLILALICKVQFFTLLERNDSRTLTDFKRQIVIFVNYRINQLIETVGMRSIFASFCSNRRAGVRVPSKEFANIRSAINRFFNGECSILTHRLFVNILNDNSSSNDKIALITLSNNLHLIRIIRE